MKLEDQITNLELSKKLKELGVKQESLFYWVYSKVVGEMEGKKNGWLLVFFRDVDHKEKYSAFTVAELGEMLPKNIQDKENGYLSLSIYYDFDEWVVDYQDEDQYPTYQVMLDTEANARAKMLIYLLENKLI